MFRQALYYLEEFLVKKYLFLSNLALFLLLSLIVFSGCSPKKLRPGEPIPINSVAHNGLLPREVVRTVLRREYLAALEQSPSFNNVRLIEVFDSESSATPFRKYRLFDVREGSVYDFLGLKTADIVIGAAGYVIPSHEKFWEYLVLGRNLPEMSLDIRREGKPMRFVYKFIG